MAEDDRDEIMIYSHIVDHFGANDIEKKYQDIDSPIYALMRTLKSIWRKEFLSGSSRIEIFFDAKMQAESYLY